MAKDIEVKVKYIPDTSALKNAMNGAQNIDFKVGGNGLKKELLSPVQNAMKEVNKAIASGANNKDLLKLFQNVDAEASKVQQKISLLKTELNATFNSAGNQQMLKQLAQYRKELEKVERESAQWTKKYGNAAISKLKDNAGVKSADQARKEKAALEADVKIGKELTSQEQLRLAALKEYVDTLEERNRLQKQGITSGSFEDQRKNIIGKIDTVSKSVQTEQFNAAMTREYASAQSYVGNASSYAAAEQIKLKNAIQLQNEEVKEGTKQLTKFGDVLTGTFLGTSLGNILQTSLSKGIQFFKEYDEVLTRTMMVTTLNREEVNSLTESYNKLANQLSSTTKDVAAAQLVFYQQGLATQEALKMTEASIAISKTGGIEAEEAANRLTAAIRGYQLAASDAMDIADKMSALDAAAASSVDELTIAMQKSASQARMAGLDLDYYMAYLSTMQEVTREAPENIGTAMKSITSRMQEIRDIGKIEEDGTTFSNVAKALNSIGIAATDSSGQLRNLQDIMDDLGPMWATLDRNHKAYIATTLAGNRQQSRFIALMDNYDRALELVDVSQNASGETAKQLRDYNTGLEASFTRLTNAWEQFATKIADSSMIKKVIDTITDLVELVNKLPDGLIQATALFLTFSKAFSTFSKLKGKGSDIMGWLGEKTGVTDFTKGIQSGFDAVNKKMDTFMGKIKSLNDTKLDLVDDIEKTNAALGETVTATEAAAAGSTQMAGAATGASGAMISTAGGAEQLTQGVEGYNEAMKNNTLVLSTEAQELTQISGAAATAAENYEKAAQSGSKPTGMGARYDLLAKQMQDIDAAKQFTLETHELYVEQLLDELKKTKPRKYNTAMKRWNQSDPTKVQQTIDFAEGGYVHGQLREKDLRDYAKDLDPDFAAKLREAEEHTSMQLQEFNNRYDELAKESTELLNKIDEHTAAVKDNTNALKKDTGSKDTNNEMAVTNDSKFTEEAADMLGLGEEDIAKPIKEAGEEVDKFNKKVTNTGKKGKKSTKDLGEGFGKIGEKVKELDVLGKAFSAFAIGSMTSMITNLIPGINDQLAETIGLLTGMMQFGSSIGKNFNGITLDFTAIGKAFKGINFKNIGNSFKSIGKNLKGINFKAMGASFKSMGTAFKGANFKNMKQALGNIKISGQTIGMVLAIAATAAIKAWNYVDEAAEKAEEQFNKSMDAWDQSSEGYKNLTTAYETYESLSSKINKTAEEQEQLNSVIAEMAELAPGALVGYDSKGNAILDQAKMAAALDEERIKNAEKAGTAMTDALVNANAQAAKESINGWDKAGAAGIAVAGVAGGAAAGAAAGAAIGTVVPVIGNAIGAVVGGIIGGVAGYFAGTNAMEEWTRNKVANELANKLQEQSSTVYKSLMEQNAYAISQGAADSLQERESLAAYMINSSYTDFINDTVAKQRKGDLNDDELEDLSNEYQYQMDQAFTNLGKVGGMDKMNRIVDQMQTELQKGATWSSLEEGVDDKLNAIFEDAGIDDETAEALMDGIIGKIFENMVNTDALKDQVQKIIDDAVAADENYDTTYLDNFKTSLNSMNQGTVNALGQTGLLNDIEGNQVILSNLSDDIENINKAAKNLDGTLNQEAATVATLSALYKDMNESLVEEDIEAYEEAIQQLYATMENPPIESFAEIAKTVEDSIKDFNTLIDVVEKLNETGGILDLDTFSALLGTLDEIDAAIINDFGNVGTYANAFDNLANSLQVVDGQLHLNAQSVEYLATIQREAFIAEMKQKVMEVDAAIEANKFERQLMLAQMEALKEGLEFEGSVDQAEIAMENKLRSELSGIEKEWLNSESQKYANYVGMVNSALTQAADSFEKYYYAIQSGDFSGMENLEQNSEEILKGITDQFVDDSFDYEGVTGDEFNTIVKEQIKGLNEMLKKNDADLQVLEAKKAMYQGMIKVAEQGNGALGAFANGQADAADEYNEKLKETLTLIEKIEGLTHKISENDAFKNLYAGINGEKEGKLLLDNLALYQDQYELQKELFAMQQKHVNQAAGNLLDSPYGELFSIAENGDIGWASPESYEIYKNLPDEAQEDIDGLVEAFQEERDTLRDTESELVKYAEATKKAREEVVELTLEAENTILEALKNREKILHDARVKALDDEIAMIEEAVDARQKARDEANDEKELYQAQEALRRATLDSSGKNNAQLLQLQQDLEDKQLEISEKRFENDMEDRKNWLNDCKDAETESYEYRLETMTWYWENVQEIMNQSTESIMQFLIAWESEYRTASATQMSELELQWETTFDKLKTISDMGPSIQELTEDLESITDEVVDMNIQVEALEGQWKKATSAVQNYKNTASGAGGYNGGGYPTNTDKIDPNRPVEGVVDPNTLTEGTKTGTGTGDKKGIKMKKGDTIEFRPKGDRSKKVDVYNKSGTKTGDKFSNGEASGWGDKNGTAGDIITVGSKRYVYFSPAGGYVDTTHFQKAGGWGERGASERYYRSGGIVDYTGPAWVDGSKTKPEAFLNPFQTEQIAALADTLSKNSLDMVRMNSNITFGSINFNVASMSSAADGKKALEVFVQGANDLMAKKGIGTRLNMNVK